MSVSPHRRGWGHRARAVLHYGRGWVHLHRYCARNVTLHWAWHRRRDGYIHRWWRTIGNLSPLKICGRWGWRLLHNSRSFFGYYLSLRGICWRRLNDASFSGCYEYSRPGSRPHVLMSCKCFGYVFYCLSFLNLTITLRILRVVFRLIHHLVSHGFRVLIHHSLGIVGISILVCLLCSSLAYSLHRFSLT